MKRLAICTLATTVLLGLVSTGFATAAHAKTPTNETIWLYRDSELNPVGWRAIGTFSDSGSWIDPFAAAGGLPSPNVFTIEIKTVQTGSSGTFDMNFQGMLNLTTGSTSLSGTWTISKGTGVYATLHGYGTWTRGVDTQTGNIVITCPGVVHFD
jgi:hypothetical protein